MDLIYLFRPPLPPNIDSRSSTLRSLPRRPFFFFRPLRPPFPPPPASSASATATATASSLASDSTSSAANPSRHGVVAAAGYTAAKSSAAALVTAAVNLPPFSVTCASMFFASYPRI